MSRSHAQMCEDYVTLEELSCADRYLRWDLTNIFCWSPPEKIEFFKGGRSYITNASRCAATWDDIIKVASQVLNDV